MSRHHVYVHFDLAEFACKCGECGSDGSEMNPDFVRELDWIRTGLGVPMVISSGYRCPDYNDRIASTGRDGPHTTGQAADVAIAGEAVFTLVRLAQRRGMTGIGLNQKGKHSGRFVHLDNLAAPDHPRPRVWTY